MTDQAVLLIAQNSGALAASQSGPGWVDLARMTGALLVVIGMAIGLGYLMRRSLQPSSHRRLKVEERLMLTRAAQLVVVADGERRLLVGLGADKSLSLIAELDELSADEIENASSEPADHLGVTFYERLSQRLESMRTSKRRSA